MTSLADEERREVRVEGGVGVGGARQERRKLASLEEQQAGWREVTGRASARERKSNDEVQRSQAGRVSAKGGKCRRKSQGQGRAGDSCLLLDLAKHAVRQHRTTSRNQILLVSHTQPSFLMTSGLTNAQVWTRFSGSSYDSARPPYPPALVGHLLQVHRQTAGLPHTAVDLGCGPVRTSGF